MWNSMEVKPTSMFVLQKSTKLEQLRLFKRRLINFLGGTVIPSLKESSSNLDNTSRTLHNTHALLCKQICTF